MTAPVSVPSGANAILLLAPPDQVHAVSACVRIAAATRPERTRVISVSYTRDATTLLSDWVQAFDAAPESMAVVEATDDVASASPADNVETIAEPPSDLTWLGIRINEYLTQWRERDVPVSVCLDSLTSLFQYAETSQGVKFVHRLSSRARNADAVLHYHMDPTAHDENEVAQVTQFCDAVVSFRDGSWNVRTA